MQVEDFLADLRSVLIDREGQYGEAGKSFRRIARFWSMYLTERTGVKVTLSPMDVGQMMNLFKMSRIVNTPVPPEDSSIDQCGYSALACVVSHNAAMGKGKPRREKRLKRHTRKRHRP